MLVEFFGTKDNAPKPQSYTWQEIKTKLTTYAVRSEKDGACFSPVTYETGAPRGNKGVQAVNFAVFDLDHITRDEVDLVRRSIQNNRLDAVLYSTFSHNPPTDNCFRLAVKLTKPVPAADWPKVRKDFITRLGIPADPATKDPARVYYYPTVPPGASPEFYSFEGGGLDPTQAPAPAPKLTTTVDLGDLKARLKRVKKEESKELVKRMLAGEPLAEPGSRDDAMFKAAGVLVYTCPEAPDEALLEIAIPSLKAMESGLGFEGELDKFTEKLSRQRVNQEKSAEESRALREAFMQDLRDQGPVKDTGLYTEDELNGWMAEQRCPSVEDFKKRWIIVQDDCFYVFVDGRYLAPLRKDALKLSYMRDLARAPIDWETVGAKGPRFKTLDEILADYASVARGTTASLALQKSYYDPATQVFHEATCPLQPFTPTYHQDVHDWLKLLGGGLADKLLDWLACVTLLNYQSAAIFLEGGRGTGKGLLASGLAKLWSVGSPTPFKDLVGSFTESVANCPFVWADEGFPKTRDFSLLDELRRWIGSSNQTLTRKYRTSAKVNGAIRLLLAANNDRILDGMEEMTDEDRHALGERLIHVPVGSAPRVYLEGLSKQTLDEFADHKIAEHVLWLRDNRKVTPGRRFIVEGSPVSTLHERLSISGGLAPAVCEFLINRIMSLTPALATNLLDELRVGNGQVWVSNRAFQDKGTWELLVPGTRFPDSNTLYRTLANMRSGQVHVRTKGKARTRFNVIRVDLLKTWNSINGTVDTADLMDRVNENNGHITHEAK